MSGTCEDAGGPRTIAITGIGGILPGARNLDEFWANVLAGRDAARDVPAGRWGFEPQRVLADGVEPDRVYATRGCFVDETFATRAAGTTKGPQVPGPDGAGAAAPAPAVPDGLDAMQRIALSAGLSAWSDASTAGIDRTRTGVILAAIALPTEGASELTRLLALGTGEGAAPAVDALRRARVTSFPAALIARALGLGGASYTLDAACASSLYAIKLACDELAAGRADAMLAGGVSRPDCLFTQMGFSQLRALSPSGRCRPFDAAADGLLVGEGAGVVLLRRLEDAQHAGERIYGVIRGIGLSNDVGGSLLAADAEGQLRALRAAYAQAGWRPTDVDLIECHGTGTPVGDAAELRALGALWGPAGWRPGQCVIGSVKSNVGHLLTAAGAAGLIKLLLAMRAQRLPPTANFERPAPGLDPARGPFRVATVAEAWPRRGRDADAPPRRAGLSAFGFGGINAHLLVEAFEPAEEPSDAGRSRRGFGGHLRSAAGGFSRNGRDAACARGATPEAGRRGAPRDDDAGGDALAIVGVGSHLGTAATPRAFAEHLAGTRSALREPPPQRWRGMDDWARRAYGHATPRGAYIEALRVPMGALRVPPAELVEILPQQTLMLLVAREALRDAGLASRERRDAAGVFIGAAFDYEATNYHLRWLAGAGCLESGQPAAGPRASRRLNADACPPLNAARTVGALGNIIASRIAREFCFGGAGFSVYAEEASGIVGLHIAAQALRRRELDVALVGAVDLAADPRAMLVRDAARHADGGAVAECAGSHGASGRAGAPAPGDAASAVVLKRLADAIRAGDPIYAVVRDVELHGGDGTSNGTERRAEERGSRPTDATGATLAARIGDVGAATGLARVVGAALELTLGPPARPAGAGDARVIEVVGLDGLIGRVELRAAPRGATRREPAPEAAPDAAAEDEGASVIVRIGGPPLATAHAERPAEPMEAVSTEQPGARGTPPRRATAPCAPASRAGGAGPGRGADGAGAPRAIGALALADAAAAAARGHDAYLRFRRAASDSLARALHFQGALVQALAQRGAAVGSARRAAGATQAGPMPVERAGAVERAGSAEGRPIAFGRAACLEFARGSIARVLGPQYAEIDSFPTRVRLPDEPLMLVDRIVRVEGVPRSLSHGRVRTEHDVRADAWYLDAGRAPACIAIEAGQADLFLCAYLGIDFVARGVRMYRLLDATVTFHRSLPRPGETVSYDIEIERFIRRGETWMFAFRFEATTGGRPLLSMRGGRAGFFTPEEVRRSGGIVLKAEETRPAAGRLPADWRGLAPMRRESYDAGQVAALYAGDLAGCFGPPFAGLETGDAGGLPRCPAARGGRAATLRLLERVEDLDPTGGRFGLGRVRAAADVRPDDWYLTCHFVDDMTMPGTLMYEYCLHALRVFLLRMGWVAQGQSAGWEPIPGVATRMSCRGPVTAETRTVLCQVDLKELGYGPEPYAIADALMFADGRRIVRFDDMTIRLAGASRGSIEGLWARRQAGAGASRRGQVGREVCAPRHAGTAHRASGNAGTSGATQKGLAAAGASSSSPAPAAEGGAAPIGGRAPAADARAAVNGFDERHILTFVHGSPSEAFGAPYRAFDCERRMARLPAPPFSFISRVTEIHAEAWRLEAGGWIETQYDVPADAWYFRANRQPVLPFAVLLEVGLQSCGWLAAYMGSALHSDEDLWFRNLDGRATAWFDVPRQAGTLTTRVRVTGISKAAGMIIEKFDFQVWCAGRMAYAGETSFGFFSEAALRQQTGIRGGAGRRYEPTADELRRAARIALPGGPPLTPVDPSDDRVAEDGGVGAARLPARAFQMIDEIGAWIADGGPSGRGFIRGAARVDPSAWFFAAHFPGDPVWPGSLGLESFLQLLKAAALERWGARAARSRRFASVAPGRAHAWSYRGQIVPTNRQVEVEATVTWAGDDPRDGLLADGLLSVDGMPIYAMSNLGVCLVPA